MAVWNINVRNMCQSQKIINLSQVNQSLLNLPKNCLKKEMSKVLKSYMAIIICQQFTKEPVLQSCISIKVIQKYKMTNQMLMVNQYLRRRCMKVMFMALMIKQKTKITQIKSWTSNSIIKELTQGTLKTFPQILIRQNHT